MNVVGSGERKSFQKKYQNDVVVVAVVVVVQSRLGWMDVHVVRRRRWAFLNMYPVMREEAADALASPARQGYESQTRSHLLRRSNLSS